MVLSVTQMNFWYFWCPHILFYFIYLFFFLGGGVGGGVLFYSKEVNSFIHNTL